MHKYSQPILIALGFLGVAFVLAWVISTVGSSTYGEWRLVFQQFHSPARLAGLALGCAIAVGCIVQLFRYERHLISRSLGLVLLLLRLSLVLVLLLTLLEPVWTWSFEEEKRGRVVIAIDGSESMDTVDTHATDAERLRWARAAGMLANPEIAGRVESWRGALERGEEPVWVTPEEVPDPERRNRVANVRRENLRELMGRVDALSRLDLAIQVLTAAPGTFLSQTAEQAELNLAAFAGDVATLDATSLEALHPFDELPLDRRRSDLTLPANAALAGADDAELAAIIVISDGRDTSDSPAERQLSRLAALGVPVHTVLAGSEIRPRDLAVSMIDHPETVFQDDVPLVKALIQTSGFDGEEVDVILEPLNNGDREPIRRTVTPGGPVTEVEFRLDKLELGRHRFLVRMDVAENEIRSDNNDREFSLEVVDDRAHVLLLEGEGRWEFRFLESALERDERVAVERVLFQQPYLGVLPRPFFPSRLDDLDFDEDGSTTPYSKYDLIVLGDVPPPQLPIAQWKLLDRYVRDEGGTLVMTAGKRFFPGLYQDSRFDALIPIENRRTIDLRDPTQAGPPGQRGFRLMVTPDGENLPMFQLGVDPNDSARIWNRLPGHLWGIVGEAKGGSSVWAAALEPGARPGLEHERKNAVLVQRHTGAGQVIWLGIDSTWRWRFRHGDEYHHRFWGQFARWAVAFKAASGQGNVRFGFVTPVIDSDQEAVIRAAWDRRFLNQYPGLEAHVVLEPIAARKGPARRVKLTPQRGNPLVHEAHFEGLDAGDYVARLDLGDLPWERELPTAPLVVNQKQSVELRDISSDRAFLEEIASRTGGKFLLLDQLHTLNDQFRNLHDVTSIHEEIPVWSHWIVLALFCTLAMSEWVIRKINGLP